MELVKAIEIVKSLADGLDPQSNDLLVNESVYQNPDTARALYTALTVLEETRQREERKALLPPNSYQPVTAACRPLLRPWAAVPAPAGLLPDGASWALRGAGRPARLAAVAGPRWAAA
jgi:hypothetical protein